MASFMYVRIWKHQRHSFAGKQIHKMWYSWRMEYDTLRKETANLKTDYRAKEANMKESTILPLSQHTLTTPVAASCRGRGWNGEHSG